MTADEFSEALRHLVGKAVDGGLSLPILINLLEELTAGMREESAGVGLIGEEEDTALTPQDLIHALENVVAAIRENAAE